MSVHDAKPGDIYADEQGKLWRVVGIFSEPTVQVQEIEPATPESPVKRLGGVSGLMWNGFIRIFRPIEPTPTAVEGLHWQAGRMM